MGCHVHYSACIFIQKAKHRSRFHFEFLTTFGTLDIDITLVQQFVKLIQSKMLRFKLVPYSKVLNLLNSLSKSKATGLDKISGKILKAAASSIASSLTYIFNHALISSHFPSEWKVARLLPLFKKGPRNLAENYRPISILPSISKLMERIMYDQLYLLLLLNLSQM